MAMTRATASGPWLPANFEGPKSALQRFLPLPALTATDGMKEVALF